MGPGLDAGPRPWVQDCCARPSAGPWPRVALQTVLTVRRALHSLLSVKLSLHDALKAPLTLYKASEMFLMLHKAGTSGRAAGPSTGCWPRGTSSSRRRRGRRERRACCSSPRAAHKLGLHTIWGCLSSTSRFPKRPWETYGLQTASRSDAMNRTRPCTPIRLRRVCADPKIHCELPTILPVCGSMWLALGAWTILRLEREQKNAKILHTT